MYAGSMRCGGFVTVGGTITALSPIAHGEPPVDPEKKNNNRPIRRITISASGSFVPVPVVSSGHLTHLFRTLLVRDALKKAGVTDEQMEKIRDKYPELYQTLFSGGTLEKKNQEAKTRKKRKDDLRSVFPDPETFTGLFYANRLFGGAITWLDDIILESVVGVEHAWPLVQEVAALRGLTAADLQKHGMDISPSSVLLNQVEPAVFTRMDETAKGKKSEKNSEDAEDGRMIYHVEYVPAGTKFLHEMYVETKEDVVLILSAIRYLAEKLLTEHPFVGGLIKRGFGKVKFDYTLPEKWGERDVKAEVYEEYVNGNARKIREKIDKMMSV